MSQVSLNGEDRVGKWERHKPEFRKQAVERMEEAKNLGLLAKELGISVRTLYHWKDAQLGRPKKVREPVPREKKLEDEIRQLKQSLANRALEVDFFKGALQKVAARRQRGSNSGEKASTTRSGK
jgi:transposase-like protein